MRTSFLLSFLALFTSILAAPLAAMTKWILELEPDVDITDFTQKVEADGLNKVTRKFDSTIFHAVVVESQNQNVDSWQSMPEVKNAWVDEVVSIPECGTAAPCVH